MGQFVAVVVRSRKCCGICEGIEALGVVKVIVKKVKVTCGVCGEEVGHRPVWGNFRCV